MIYKITHDRDKLILEFEGNRINLRSLEEIPKYIRFLSEDSPMPKKSRKEMILKALDTGEFKTIQQILDRVGASQDEQRNFASTCLNLVEKKILQRKKTSDGLFAYALR